MYYVNNICLKVYFLFIALNRMAAIFRTLSIISGAHQFHSVTFDKRLNNTSINVVPVVSVVVNSLSTKMFFYVYRLEEDGAF